MATDVVFFLKTFATNATKALPWPGPVALIGLDPLPGCKCGGADALCSSAYSCTWQSLRAADGRVLPNLLARYAKGIDVGRVAFVGFSAAHGLLNPLLNNDADRADISAVIMMDTCFGGGKTGFQKALADAAAGKMLYATLTSSSGGSWASQTDLTSGTFCFRKNVVEPIGLKPKAVSPRAPMPMPSGGCWQFGQLGYWLQFADPQTGQTELHHYSIKTSDSDKMMQAYLIPYWNGELGGWSWQMMAGAALAIGGGAAAYYIWSTRR